MSEVALPISYAVPERFRLCDSQIRTDRSAKARRSLALLLITGAVVALVDGITRAPNADWESMPFQNPLQYVPYKAAFVFAALLLPLTLRYARQVGSRMSEALLLWFVMCIRERLCLHPYSGRSALCDRHSACHIGFLYILVPAFANTSRLLAQSSRLALAHTRSSGGLQKPRLRTRAAHGVPRLCCPALRGIPSHRLIRRHRLAFYPTAL